MLNISPVELFNFDDLCMTLSYPSVNNNKGGNDVVNAIFCTVRSQLRDFSPSKHHQYWNFAGSIAIKLLDRPQGRD